jgi:hypothetical protein
VSSAIEQRVLMTDPRAIRTMATMSPARPHRLTRSLLAGLGTAAFAAALVLPATTASAAPPPKSTLITARVGIDGKGGQENNGTNSAVISPTGRYVAFYDLGTHNTWVEDLITGATTQVSVTPDGTPANNTTWPVAISTDGNRIALLSMATNLGPAPHTKRDLYVRDRKANTTVRANIAPNGSGSEVYDQAASMSDAGDAVAWTSIDGPVYRRRLTPASTQRIDVSSAEVAANDKALDSSMSGDGKHVVFNTYATNLVAVDGNPFDDVYERDIVTGTTIKVSLGVNGVEPNQNARAGSVSYDGRYVAFEADANNLTPADKNQNTDVFVRDTVAQSTTIASVTGASSPIDGNAVFSRISGDGKHVLFQTTATGIAANDVPGTRNLFRRDLALQFTDTVDQSTGLALANKDVEFQAGMSSDGSVTAFGSAGTNLVEGDTNGRDDVFVRMPETMGPHNSMSQLSATVLDRFTGSPSGTGAATSDLLNGRVFPGHLISQLAKAPAFAQHREPVTRLYFAFFERQPDLNGLNYWVNKRTGGTTLNVIATKFAQSSEFKTKYGKVDNTGFVTLVYQNVLDRNPDEAGLDHWVAKMADGMTRGQVMVQFSESNEGKRHLAGSVDTSLIGLGMLKKMATPADFAAARDRWEIIGGPEGAALWFLDSDAYYNSFK